MTGISRRTIQDIEKRGDCLVSNAKKLAQALDVSLDELCAG
ncbi:MAG: helix-turn-helix domain-containing protein [Clostridia bacterium]